MNWRYHLGVHKTASTHLQRIFEFEEENLRLEGIDYIPLKSLRARTERIVESKFLQRARFNWAVRSSAPTVLLSEENWLGHPKDACRFPIYPHLQDRLKVVSRHPAAAFLAIRNPAEFAASVYTESLRHSPSVISLAETREAFLTGQSPWLEMIERVISIFPNLRVWPYELYRKNANAYASLVAGTHICAPVICDPPETQRLPLETVNLIEQIRQSGEKIPPIDELPKPPNITRFDMFDEFEKEKINLSYINDIDKLRKIGILVEL